MEHSADAVQKLVEMSSEVNHHIQNVSQTMTSVLNLAQENGADIVSIDQRTEDINKEFHTINNLSHKTAKSVEEIASAAEHLSKLTGTLNGRLAIFKTD